MTIELLVIIATAKAPSATAWDMALQDSHSPVRIEAPDELNLLTHTGFVPVNLGAAKSGFYFLRESYSDATASYPAIRSLEIEIPVVFSLGYGGDVKECAAAFYAAKALVSEFGGAAFDTTGHTFVTSAQLLEGARLCLKLVRGE